ncbi:MAG: arginine deiminase-related protein [Planctomycetota bacterium]|nr:arginine deiminase-related protein [Planctomycetota bacterium]
MSTPDTIAIVRPVPDSIGSCELTHVDRTPIDLATAHRQHQHYVETLSALGCEIITLPPLHDHPDSVFVEDPAFVLDEMAFIARSGAESRRGEAETVADALAAHRSCHRIEAPACIDGGDVLLLGRTLYVGLSSRTNAEAHRQLRDVLAPMGYEVRSVPLHECLHLKTGATAIADDAVLFNPAWVPADVFEGLRLVECHPDEPFSGNVVRVGSTLVADSAWERTNRRLVDFGCDIAEVHLGELTKAEGSVTCSSIVFRRVD